MGVAWRCSWAPCPSSKGVTSWEEHARRWKVTLGASSLFFQFCSLLGTLGFLPWWHSLSGLSSLLCSCLSAYHSSGFVSRASLDFCREETWTSSLTGPVYRMNFCVASTHTGFAVWRSEAWAGQCTGNSLRPGRLHHLCCLLLLKTFPLMQKVCFPFSWILRDC